MAEVTVEVSSTLSSPAHEVWAQASTLQGVNYELAPWVRMTAPRTARPSLADAPIGTQAFASVLLLFGVFPFDVHHLFFERVYEFGFDEESWSWLNRRWRHERRIVPNADGTKVTDRLTVEPRLAPKVLVALLVRQLFLSRHRRLRRAFGDARQPQTV
jgi:ligand-binding SRPBCC domain-containing protein